MILKALSEAEDGDYVFYLDSGYFLTADISALVSVMERSDDDIMAFSTYYPERQWTKKELFRRMECDESRYRDSNQFMATMCLIRVSAESRRFFSDFLNLAQDSKNISDSLADDTESDFIEHRHDQSIFSLLCKKNDLISFRPPYVFGERGAAYAVMLKTGLVYGKKLEFNFTEFNNSDYPTMLQVNKRFRFFGTELNLFIIPYIYFGVLNALPFRSKAYDALLRIGTRDL